MSIFYIVLALLALGVLVFVHELGHFIVAKWVGMNVEIFSIGFGKPILKWKWRDVDWQVGALPFGGYVKIAGMDLGKSYENEGGFFTKSPLSRMAVVLAGPLANFLLTIVCFWALFLSGGRQKPFSEFTQVVGWVDPTTELYSSGLRSGDLLCELNGESYKGTNDLLMGTLFGPKKTTLAGEHINYFESTRTPFFYTVEKTPLGKDEEKLFSPPLSGAKYLIYDHIGKEENPFPKGSPMEESSIRYGDRIVWADGMLIFSLDELGYIINDERAFLLVKRGDHTFYTRQKRVMAGDLIMPTQMRSELTDWSYEAGIKKRWQQLKVLPYQISSDGTVESQLHFMDEEAKRNSFPAFSLSTLEEPLQNGDKILAVDGVKVEKASQMLDLLQNRHVELIVEGNAPVNTSILWKEEDDHFLSSFNVSSIKEIAQTIGKNESKKEAGHYRLLNPVQPKRISEFPDRDTKKEIPEKENRYLLGIVLQDQGVIYNPTPLFLFNSTLVQTWQTLKALVMGQLHPKYLTGPVGIVQVIHRSWELGIKEALFWVGIISLNLGFFNLLPLPILDGGYFLMSLVEIITRRRIKPKTLERLILPFAILLIALILFVTFYDLTRLFK